MSIVEHGLGLNVTVLSYAGQMHFGFTAAHNVVGDAHAMSDLLEQSLRELQRSLAKPERPGRRVGESTHMARDARSGRQLPT
jgi:hypothetical protein